MDEARLLRAVLGGVMGGRRKRGRRALRHLTAAGGSLWTNPTVLMTAAGVAWGLIETVTGEKAAAAARATPAAPPVPAGPLPPPLAGPGAPLSDGMRLTLLAVSAAHADGNMSEAERAAVERAILEHGADPSTGAALLAPRPLAEIVAGVTDRQHCTTLYGLAFSIVRADEQVSGAERIYLAQLAHLLGLDAATAGAIEQRATAQVDAVDDRD